MLKESGQIALVQGASRGIGLEFVRQLAERSGVERVFATCRDPATADDLQAIGGNAPVETLAMDVEDEDSIREAAGKLSGEISRIDLLINCAGLLHDGQAMGPERRLDQLDPVNLHRSFAVNAIGPALVVKHFRPLLQASEQPVVANISARVGSITDNRLGGWYAYRASKAAQNMLTRSMAIELGRGSRPVTLISLHPGTVDTDLSRPFQRNVPDHKLFSTRRAVGQLLAIIDGVTPAESGRFFAWDGSEIPW
jgi:NAD(P)-dependent dehydrogenase (short-subunit alcohol dehydrogenase family)